jgi:ethanolamine ammonia-lyase small subunit
MSDQQPRPEIAPTSQDISEVVRKALARTPARLLVGRAGPAYRTATWLKLREDHAFARDAVYTELDLQRDFGPEFVREFGLFMVQTEADSKAEFLIRPDLGRRLSEEARKTISDDCLPKAEIQVVIGDGLSATAVTRQVPELLQLLKQEAAVRGWKFGQPFVVRYCRVGVLNDVGELLTPQVVILLIGERPGLATAESLSAYLAYRPAPGDTDANRNLISNIHKQGATMPEAAQRIVALAAQMMAAKASGVAIKEAFQPAAKIIADVRQIEET